MHWTIVCSGARAEPLAMKRTFGSDPVAIARWRSLVAWFERTTGLVLGAPPPFPPNQCNPTGLAAHQFLVKPRRPLQAGAPVVVSRAEILGIRPAWPNLDPRIAAVMADPEILSAYKDDSDQWDREAAGHETLVGLQDAHRKLQEAAQAVLDAEAGKVWSWASMVPQEAVAAARLLATLPDPHGDAVSTGQGDRVLPRLRVALRGRLVTKLASIARPKGKRQYLSARELTALLLLTLPSSGGLYELPFWKLWTSWETEGRIPSNDTTEKSILGSVQFARLQDAVKQDRNGARNPTS